MFNIYYSYTYFSRNVDDHSLCSTQTNLYHFNMCYSFNAYFVGKNMSQIKYKNHDDIPKGIVDYITTVADTSDIKNIPIDIINDYLYLINNANHLKSGD